MCGAGRHFYINDAAEPQLGDTAHSIYNSDVDVYDLRNILHTSRPITSHKLTRTVTQHRNTVVQIGLFRLLCLWLDNCVNAVRIFLSMPNNVPLLVEIVLSSQQGSGNGREGEKREDDVVHIEGLCCLLLGE